ncbi:MAG: hypothetical protein ACI867_000051 [Glaciecola sp.]
MSDPVDGPVVVDASLELPFSPLWPADDRQRLRVNLETSQLDFVPGEESETELRVLNTSGVIEQVSVEIVGVLADSVQITPRQLTMFPHESAVVRLRLRFDERMPAGDHDLLVVAAGASGRLAPAIETLTIVVPPIPAIKVKAEPPLRTAGRKGNFDLSVANTGNTPLTVRLRAVDANRALSLVLEKQTFTLPVDQSEILTLTAKGRRPFSGTPIDHLVTVDVVANGLEEVAELQFRQKPRLTAGVVTLLTLLLVVGLWAAAMFFGVAQALSPPVPTKVIAASFIEGIGIEDLDATVVGGSVSGTVTSTSTGQPLASIAVEAFRLDGSLVAATATEEDGSFELTGLLPVRHRLFIRGSGFVSQSWPDLLLASPDGSLAAVNVALVGAPGALGGQAIAGDGAAVLVLVEALDLIGGGSSKTIEADSDGVWSTAGLTAPAIYRITYQAEGYSPVVIMQPLDAGQQLVLNTTRLPAARGQLRGTVVDGRTGLPVGGVEVLALRGADDSSFTTPTSGSVGVFVFEGLETPATYLLTFTAAGYAPQTRTFRLGPGERTTNLLVFLSPATGELTGTVRSVEDGQLLGGVQVLVTGRGYEYETETLAPPEGVAGAGAFQLRGLPLPLPGARPFFYTVTFVLEGRLSETVRIDLSSEVSEAAANVRMAKSVGSFSGLVFFDDESNGLGAVEIEVSDGETVRTTKTGSLPEDERGTFRIEDLAPGSYTITARRSNGESRTVLGEISAGRATEIKIDMGVA